MTADEVANDIVDAALKVHRALGPGLLASAYQELHALFLACLALLAFCSSGERRGNLHKLRAHGGALPRLKCFQPFGLNKEFPQETL
jgi:hypothetical protein